MPYVKRFKFFAFILPLYFFTRLVNFLIIPIFTDEAIYSYWAQVALHDPANRFISLEDGKQPLFIWFAAFSQKFIADPLIATRIVSVFAGLGTTLGIYLLAKELLSERVARISALLYIVLPFALLYDRLALFDSLLTMFCVWAILFSVKMAKNPRLDLALLNGITLGLGLITKSSAIFFLYLLPFSLLLFDFKKVQFIRRLTKWASLSFITVVLAQVIYNSLRVSPLFYMIDRKNHEFIRTFSEVAKNPLQHFSGNFDSMITWSIQYNGPLIILALLPVAIGFIKKEKKIILLSIYILAPFFITAVFNKVLYPRFALFYFPVVIILIAYGAVYLLDLFTKRRSVIWLLLLFLIAYPLFSSLKLLTDPPGANIASADKNQYLNDWPAGSGVSPVVDILKKQTANQKVYVGTEGTFGLLPFALQIYFYGNPNIEIVGYWPVGDIPKQTLESAKTKKTFFVFNENQKESPVPDTSSLKLIGKFQKGSGNSFMRLYEVVPR